MRRKIIAGNWKMNKSFADAGLFFGELNKQIKDTVLGTSAGPELVIFPQAPILSLAKTVGARIKLGSQHSYWEEKGAFTGELSPALAVELGATYALAGHSERRQSFAETSESAVKRALFADRLGLRPMLCIGETLAERDANQTEEVLRAQLEPLFRAEKAGLPTLVLAYEPVWAIGTGRTATIEQAEQAHAFIRLQIANQWGGDNAESLPILYGGSVKAENAKALMSCANVDGCLVGGASLDLSSFLAIAAAAIR